MDDSTLHAQIDMGNLADEWWKSELGQYVLGRCGQIIENAQRELLTADPADMEKIRKLQTDAWKAGAVPGFLNELLVQGRQALNTLESTDDLMED